MFLRTLNTLACQQRLGMPHNSLASLRTENIETLTAHGASAHRQPEQTLVAKTSAAVGWAKQGTRCHACRYPDVRREHSATDPVPGGLHSLGCRDTQGPAPNTGIQPGEPHARRPRSWRLQGETGERTRRRPALPRLPSVRLVQSSAHAPQPANHCRPFACCWPKRSAYP